MKTALVTTTHLVPQERYDKTVKFVRWYERLAPHWDIIVLDNASPIELADKLQAEITPSIVHRFPDFHGRPSPNDYLYLWRAVYHLQHVMNSGYEKVIYMDNDFYVLSHRMRELIDQLTDGWTTFWCSLWNYNETGCHVVVKGTEAYHNYVASGNYHEHNNEREMENLLPVTRVIRDAVGDRYGERDGRPVNTGMDFYAQMWLSTNLPDSPF